MSSVPSQMNPELVRLLEAVCELAAKHEVFDSARCEDGRVVVHAAEAPEEVLYRLEWDDGTLYVSWVCADRYISQSIEAELMWTGDDLDDMIDEELADTGWTHGRLGEMEHFRNDEQLFTFRSAIRVPMERLDAPSLLGCLVAYHHALSELGDMKPDED